MNTKTKKSLLILAIIALVVINISALVTIFYKSRLEPPTLSKNSKIKEPAETRGMYHFLKEELNLSEEQFEQFQDINRRNMSNSHEIISEMHEIRINMMTEIAKQNPNLQILDSYAYQIGTLHYKLKKLTINNFIELKEICNEEQQEKLQKLFMKLISDQDHDSFRHEPRERGRNRHGKSREQN